MAETGENQDLRQRVRLQVNRGLRQTFRAYNPGQEMPPETLRAMTNRVSDAVLAEVALHDPRSPDWDGEHCQVCGQGYDDVFWLPDEWWDAISPKQEAGAGLLCPRCVLVRTLAHLDGALYRPWDTT